MKNNWKLLWNPFTRIAGWQAFGIGLVFVILSAIVGKYANLLFDGAIDAHLYDETVTFARSFILSGISIFWTFIAMTLSAFVISKTFRIIDILGTMTLARTPFLLMAIMASFVKQPNIDEILKNPMTVFSYPLFLVFGILSLPVIIWVVALMFNAFKVSTGAKGGKLIIGFIVGLILAEILSKVTIMLCCS